MNKLDQLKSMIQVVADNGDLDAMATEKLAEGIRLFAAYQEALEARLVA